ncbi:anti-sigma factor [Edaphobacter albus]|uniref:anti-sigma factor n=1 Tax=Edaphobacter sp. 4G125 TaxID=2763071 RepID=UPI001646D3F3|nr:anti-sigma factor [Edaphobacter sp. 4G125]QNI37115.1 anti-sigma factor [Edaphobacter sp. 4G125]
MNEHLSAATLNALVDGQLASEELRAAKGHLDCCSSCTSEALEYALLKNSVSRNGQRYSVPAEFEMKMRSLIANASVLPAIRSGTVQRGDAPRRAAFAGWAVAAAMLLAVGGVVVLEQHMRHSEVATTQSASLASEILDQHVATLANSQPPQVVSSDRHTVKPWFQGRIPFSFNLPEALPQDTKLDGANLVYLDGRPAAQLLYSIGKHRVSVFVEERTGTEILSKTLREREGYHLVSFNMGALDAIAISDVDPAKLAELVRVIEQVQNGSR